MVVHGGGKIITDWLTRLGVPSRFEKGERVTDQPTLEVVTAVLAGLVNKDIVATINSRGGRAVGIAGVDGNLIEGKVGEPGKGFVGVVTRVNAGVLESLTAAGLIPVIAPVGLNVYRQEGMPLTLNFNADVIAGDIAAAIKAKRLIFLTDVAGIMDGTRQLIARLNMKEAGELIASGVASGGMIPKIQACLKALSAVPSTCIVDGRQPDALIQTIEERHSGTVITR